MSDTDGIVFFLMPDGSKVSNDPRWLAENAARAQEEALAATPNRGNMGITEDEQRAQVGGGVAPGQSGQEGVGDYPTATIDQMVAGQVTGAVMQSSDSDLARREGFTPDDPAISAPEPVDSNAAVKTAREEEAARQEEYQKQVAKLAEAGEEPGDPNKPYTEWTAKQLKAEVATRNAAREDDDQIDISGMKKKAEVAEALQADDDAHA